MNRKCKKVCHRILKVVPVHLNKTLSFQLVECWRSIQKFRFSIYAKLRPPLNPMWSMPCFLAQQKMEAIGIQTWLRAWHGLMLWQQHNAETHEITDFHNASIERHSFFLHLNFLKLPFFSFSLPYATLANPGSRYLLLQTLQSLPALVTTFSTMECFLLLRCFTDLGHRPPCFWQNLLHFLAQSSQVKLITSTKKYGCFTFEAFQRLQSHWATWSANGSSCEFKSQIGSKVSEGSKIAR